MLPVLVLVVGMLSLGRYHDNLIQEHLAALEERARTFSIALEGLQTVTGDQVPLTIGKFAAQKPDTRIRLVAPDGAIIADSYKMEESETGIYDDDMPGLLATLAAPGTKLLAMLPSATILPPFPRYTQDDILQYSDFQNALQGDVSAGAWALSQNRLFLTAAAPVKHNGAVEAVILLTNHGRDIEQGMSRVRFDVLTATLAALSMTIFMSIYLSGLIGRPLTKLARAAERVRKNRGRHINIPDLSHRGDEIGALSLALRDMTQALWDRMDSIERFAADVAHEIKNPLTSLRSAVETVARVNNKKDRDALMAIIQNDVQRLDRLISDISDASRLDAALSREEMGVLDLAALLRQLVDAHCAPLERTGKTPKSAAISLLYPASGVLPVRGNEGRLAQVFQNLIGNALSFSPPGKPVTIRIEEGRDEIVIHVEDEGAGIPENKLDTIFERFYSERPKGEEYGKHSGLGLSISRQIVKAHGGDIYAENIMRDGRVTGARFTVILQKPAKDIKA